MGRSVGSTLAAISGYSEGERAMTQPANGASNDLWRFNPTTKAWTWVSGSSTINASAVYGSLGVAASNNVPGARFGADGWIDKDGNLWLFGGTSIVSTGAVYLNDLGNLTRQARNGPG
jgi:hypothetical protein